MRIAFVFPGQGSQSVGMLGGFADNETVRGALARADEALGFSIERLIAEGPAEELNLTVNTQPAVLASSVAFYEAWLAAGGQKPELLAGHSLGEYSALCAAGVFPLEEAVKLVRFRAEAMQSAVPVGVGGMAAIIGLSDEDVEAACVAGRAAGTVEAVNFNSPGQVVIAGHIEAVRAAVEDAKARGAHIYGEIIGSGATCAAHHITAPLEDGSGGARAMVQAVKDAGLKPEDIDYINAHGTSTPLNDRTETAAVKLAFGEHAHHLAMSSTESNTGHLLGASGAIEAIITLKALEENYIPPTINYAKPDADCDLDIVANEGREADLRYAMSNSLGFGGHNASLVFAKWEE